MAVLLLKVTFTFLRLFGSIDKKKLTLRILKRTLINEVPWGIKNKIEIFNRSREKLKTAILEIF